MSRLTLSAALTQLGSATVNGYAVFPPNATDAQKTALINEVQERFINMPSWKGIDGTASFNVYNNQITLPRELMTIKRAGYAGNEGAFKVPIRNQWYQFHLNGPGIWNPNNPRIAFVGFEDMGDGFVTFRQSAAAFKLRIVTDVAETGDITFYGFDQNGVPVYTGTDQGVDLSLVTSGGTTTQVFGAGGLGRVVKPLTNGRVSLYSVDNDTGDQALIAIYEPGETVPSYRRYQVTGSTDESRTFKCLCKRAYVQAIQPDDLLVPDFLGAYKLGLMAISCESKQDTAQADYFWGRAVGMLNSQLEEDQGDVGFTVQIQNRALMPVVRNML